MQYENVLKVGQKIVDDLGLDKSCDTLGRWMAHYIAEKMADVETATGAEAEKRKFACAEAIFHFWSHRNDVPGGMRPFKDLELVLRSLLSLDPDETAPRYYRSIRISAEDDETSSQTAEFLELASGIDSTARILILYCLVAAAGASIDKSREWVTLADTVGKTDDIDLTIIKTLTGHSETLAPETTETIDVEKIRNLVGKLEAFTNLAERLSSHFTAMLNEAEAEN